MGASIPVTLNGRTYYKTAYRNPYPEKELTDICFRKAGAYDPNSYQVLWYADAAEKIGRQSAADAAKAAKAAEVPDEISGQDN